MMIVDPYRFGGSSPGTISYQGAFPPATVGTTSTSSGVSFGAVVLQRLVVVAVHWIATTSTSVISSATIGGISAPTIIAGSRIGPNISGNYVYVAYIAAFVPTALSGTVIVNHSGGAILTPSFFVWAAASVQNATPFGTGSATSTTGPISTTCNLQAGGVAISAVSTLTTVPSALTGVTLDYANTNYAGGSAATPSAVTGASFQMTDAGGVSGNPSRSILVASFR